MYIKLSLSTHKFEKKIGVIQVGDQKLKIQL